MNNKATIMEFEGYPAYQQMMDVLLGYLPPEDLETCVHPEFTGYGSAAHEIFRDRSDLMAMARKQMQQYANQQIDFRRSGLSGRFLDGGKIYLISEEFEFIVQEDEHSFQLRVTTLLQKFGDKWLVSHMHGSSPDTNIAEDEAFPDEGLRKKNRELEAKIRERTRELEIEASLERVRARAMAMQKSDELNELIGKVFTELTALDLQLTRCLIMIYNPETMDAGWWMANSETPGQPMDFKVKYHEHRPYLEYIKAWKSRARKWNYTLEGEEKVAWDDFLFSQTELQDLPEPVIQGMKAPEKVILSASFNNFGCLSVASLEPLSEAHFDLMLRFAKVFDLTYTRFNDLQKAEAQTREAQIEMALERTRSQSMRMQHSSELNEVSKVFHEQLLLLGIDSEFSFVWLPDEAADTHLFWTTWAEGSPREWQFQSRSVVYPLDKSEPYTALCFSDWESGQPVHEHFVPSKDIRSFFDSWAELLEGAERLKAEYFPEGIYYTEAFMKYGCFGIDIRRPLTEEEKSILHRFAVEFERTYTRFLDLQKAEAQAREAQIELGLERVRARAMAMQESGELSDLVATVLDELTKLDFSLTFCIINIINEPDGSNMVWAANPQEGKAPESYYMKFEDYPFHHAMMREWKAQTPKYVYVMEGEEKEIYDEYLYNDTEFRRFPEEIKRANRALDRYVASFVFSQFGGLQTVGDEPLSEESLDILYRFGKVFDQTYTRFLDLQKAEAQAREAQIETALERVRSRTMAMQKTADISDVAVVFLDQLRELGLNFVQAWINVFHLDEGYINIWFSPLEGVYDQPANWQLPSALFENTTLKSWKAGQKFSHLTLNSKEEVDALVQACDEATGSNYFGHFQEILKLERLEFVDANYKFGTVSKSSFEKATKEEEDILYRFAKVFEQAYTRFLDLQKAEAQAREAQIEAALERVRSRSMAMQNSEELKEVIRVIFDQLALLDINAEHAGIVVDYEKGQDWNFWIAETQDIPSRISLPYLNLPWDRQFAEAKEKGKDFFTTQLNFEEKNSFYEKLLPHIPGLTKKVRDFYFKCPGLAISTVVQKDIGLYIENFTGTPYSEEEDAILMRFGKAFQQTYTRFQDLQKAEAQAREAQIETALERVRSRTMGMQSSDELREVVLVIYQQLQQLEFESRACNIIILDKDSGDATYWVTGFTKEIYPVSYRVPYLDHPYYEALLTPWKNGEKYVVYQYDGAEKINFDKIFFTKTGFKDVPIEARNEMKGLPHVVLSTAYFSNGAIQVLGPEAITEEKALVLQRFAKVFDQTYTRFLDLKIAEAQARESQIESALERVRSRTMAMQHSDELAEASHLLDKEVRGLGIKTWGCAFNIYRENDSIEWFGNEAGLLPTYTVPREGIFKQYYERGQKGESLFVKEIAGAECIAHYEYMSTLPVVGDVLKQLKETNGSFPSYQIDHVVYFKYGYLLFITREAVPEAYDIFKRFAKVFEQTYTRFLDLQLKEEQAVKLVQEKQRLEETLKDLQETQNQLIHAEKMASLGELTAGIAHEIQNPLNFVNNFSEVSRELLEEMIDELKKGDTEEVDAIAQDVIQNLEKILHHGKRADSIVKGMLQHSRSSDGKKEPTDLNALSDEYLRLAYHGLRAKDKSFNAIMETNFDDSIGKGKVVPQEIGRVLLNLITNAFHAVAERKEKEPEGYEPTVWVTTRKAKGGVELTVRDNGGGIPESIRDKIFQPFFTTKPTGEGTGLGLSMSYDIVKKGHGGDLQMQTVEGEGTEFTIKIPWATNQTTDE